MAVIGMKTDRIIGSVLALALGDAFGAPYEGEWWNGQSGL